MLISDNTVLSFLLKKMFSNDLFRSVRTSYRAFNAHSSAAMLLMLLLFLLLL